MNYIYKLTDQTIKDEDNNCVTVYGIEAVLFNGEVLAFYDDVFFNQEKAGAFVEMCNAEELSLVHFEDAVEDALAEQYFLCR